MFLLLKYYVMRRGLGSAVGCVALLHNVLWLCVRWGFPALKPNSSNKL